jgi:hypothetical protein
MSNSHRRALASLCALALALTLYLSLNANATLNNSFCTLGSEAGKCERPEALALDFETNRLYIADKGNNRIDVFKTSGEFLFAFGWGVDTGAAKAETCTTASTCQAGIAGSGAGQFKFSGAASPSTLAVDNAPASPSHHDLYVGEEANNRVQKFDPSGNFLLMFGGGVIVSGATGTGNLTSGQTTVSALKATNKEFALGQTITGAGIPAATTITAITTGASATLTLSKPAEATASGVALSVAEGAGNKAQNEKQSVELKGGPTGGTFTLTFPARQGFAAATTATIAFNATAATVRERLEALANVGAANVEVTGAAGGPWTVEFKGILADTNVGQLEGNASGLTPPGGKSVAITTTQEGTAAAEVCTVPANCQRGVQGSALGAFNSIRGVGVTGAGTVYVIDTRDIGQCEGLPANGREYERRLQKFKDTGEASEAKAITEGPVCGETIAFAAASTGDFYTFIGSDPREIRKYNASGTLVKALGPVTTMSALAVDASDALYAAHNEEKKQAVGLYFTLTKYDGASGERLRRYGYEEIETPLQGLAAAAGHVFGSERFSAPDPKILDLTEPPAGPLVPPPSLKATPGATLATLKAEVNPEGKETSYHFEYVDQQSFEAEGGFLSPKVKKTPVKAVGSAADFTLKGLTEQIGCSEPVAEGPEGKCLVPDTLYRFRILASNSDGAGNTPLEASFKTEEAPKFLAIFSTEVGPDSATLNAELNPFGLPTTGVFEYVEDAKYQLNGFAEASKAPPSGSFNFGEGEAALKRGVAAFPLNPGTTYHYRLTAANLLHTGLSKEATFRTFAQPQIEPCENDPFRYGPGALLPDCRGYEMVSPLDKGGTDILPGFATSHGVQAALDVSSLSGDKLTYGTLRAFADAESAPFISQYLAAREPEAERWLSRSLAAPKTTSILQQTAGPVLDSEFKAFSGDLCEAWLLRTSEPLLDPAGVADYPNLYRRTDSECEGSGEASYEAITRAEPLNLSPVRWGALELQGVSADGGAAIYDWEFNLEGASPTPAPQPAKCTNEGSECQPRLYEQKEGGPLEFVCILPNGEAVSGACQAGTPNGGSGNYREVSVKNAISDDGSRVFWSPSKALPAPIYVRIGGSETVAVSKAAEAEAGSSASQFWSAAEDGSVAIFTTGGRLYEFNVESETTTLVAKGVSGVLGSSEDAAKTYFASSEAIAGSGQNSEGEEAIATKPNLYLREAGVGGGIRFIATVASADVSQPPGHVNDPFLVAAQPLFRDTRVSPDGTSLAFMAAGTPTDYDNLDAASGQADTEVYLYDATEDNLLCASCNPSGARPAGEFDEYANRKLWVGAKIPTWTNTLYAPRVLSAGGGRLFFESPDALVARDTNGLRDIYEWEAPGTGSCSEAAYTYSAQNQGCVDLISSGKSARGAEFVDASPSGNDVFFTSQESLVGQDTDDLVDIYDARVGGGFAPPPPPPPICEAEACQHPTEAPQFQTPSSEQYKGPGNEEAKPKPKPRHCRKGTHKKKKNGNVRCVKNKHKKQHQSRRAAR